MGGTVLSDWETPLGEGSSRNGPNGTTGTTSPNGTTGTATGTPRPAEPQREHRSATGARTAAGSGTRRHLVHRPRSWEYYGLSAVEDASEEFALAAELPAEHPLLNDGPGRFHDIQAASEMVREVGEFIGQNHFGVPANRTGIFYRFGIDVPDLTAWRTRPGPARLTATLVVSPDKMIGAVPRALDFRTSLEIDEVRCGTGSANLVFLPPVLRRNHREQSRAAALAAVAEPAAARRGTPVDPAEVGRSNPANVLLHGPTWPSHGRLAVGVSVPAQWPPARGAGTDEGHVPALVLLESLRQASLFAALGTHQLTPARSALASLQVHFRGYAETDLAMRCAAVSGLLERDAQGRRAVPVTLTLTQAGRTVLEAVTKVVEDH
ncbi:AfsA-related hotdog domain-containing protein [Streptomyces sp. NPDC097619]|uniref:AfsA-related hotdog domain-containing protein n=1 Tax=Streptomyces sp. NPDC097619 TaxID=3157228 RepID=UPI00331C7E25